MPKKNYNKPEASKKQLEQELLEVSEACLLYTSDAADE